MPYKSEAIPLRGLQDRRRKLTDEDRAQIRQLYESGGFCLKSLAEKFHVNKSTVHAIVNPDRADYVHEYRKAHWREYRMSTEDRAAAQREHRRYKQNLYLAGVLTGATT